MKHKRKMIFCAALVVIFSVMLCSCNVNANNDNSEASTAVPVSTGKVNVNYKGYNEQTPQNSQPGVMVENTLKIESVGEQNGVLSVVVRNVTQADIQYAVLTCKAGNSEASFTFSTLLAGSTCLLTEDKGLRYSDVEYRGWSLNNRVDFSEPLSFCQDKFKVTAADGEIAVTNITDKDFKGEVCVYYKDIADGVLIGGTTYRVRIDEIKANSTATVSASHYGKENSRIMFLTYHNEQEK